MTIKLIAIDSIFLALLIVSSYISIPLSDISLTLQVLVVLLLALILPFIDAEIIIVLYILNAFMYYFNIVSFLKPFPEVRKYYRTKIIYVACLPFYNLFAFFVRFAGIINSIERKSTWKTKTFTEETNEFAETVAKDFALFPALRKLVKRLIEKPEDKDAIQTVQI